MANIHHRVAITGAGILCALGQDAQECWAALRSGRSAIARITAVDVTGLRFQNGAEVRDFRPEEHFERSRCDLMDRFSQFAVVAARQAAIAAGWKPPFSDPHRIAVVTGTAQGGQIAQDRGFAEIYKNGRPRPHPFTIPLAMSNAGASHISTEFGITGPCFTISTACASATHAIGQAFWMVRSGVVRAAIAGGSEAPFSNGLLRAWESMRVISSDTCRPFSKDRNGMILGEGAAMFALEPLQDALERGANILGEIAGFGMSADAGHITQPSVDGPAAAMASALRDADVTASQVVYINAHGTGTLANDPAEVQAIRKVFGPRRSLAVSSTKSMHGHALGAAGAIEAFATISALCEQLAPPTANFTEHDPACDIDCVPNEALPIHGDYAISNSFAFGGLNGTLLFRRWTGA
jgi:nodulation protein E